MPTDLHSGEYRAVHPYPVPMPAMTVTIVPYLGGGDFRTSEAVLDSGSEYTWVPTHVPHENGWDPEGVDPAPVSPLGGPRASATGFLATVRIGTCEWTMPVYQQLPESSLQCVLIGQDLLRKLFVRMHGPDRRLFVQVP